MIGKSMDYFAAFLERSRLAVNMPQYKKLLGITLGSLILLDGIGGLLKISLLALIGLNGYFVLAIIWAMWFGWALLQKSQTSDVI